MSEPKKGMTLDEFRKEREHLLTLILQDFHSRMATVVKNTAEHDRRYNEALDLLGSDLSQLLRDTILKGSL